MKRIVAELVILCSITVYLLISHWDKTFANQPAERPHSLGNNLSSFFYTINTRGDHATHDLVQSIKKDAIPELGNFYAKWLRIPQTTPVNYKSDPDAAWVPLYPNGSIKANYLSFWQTVRLQARQMYHDNIEKIDIEIPVLHFRCSDTPFIKHPYYHLPRSSSVKWMANTIKARGFNSAIMLNCSQHFSQDQSSCNKYAEFYRKLFVKNGVNVIRQCNSIIHDFALMVYSPMLVAINSSSFSFMAGIAKDPSDYISCNLGVETEEGYVHQPAVDWVFDKTAPLMHKEVANYSDVLDVLRRIEAD